MALETGVTYIEDLVDTNPIGATDNIDEGDDHIRNIKTAVQGSFPSLGAAAVTKTAAEINDLATLTGSETLTNKTLTSPVLNTSISGTAFLDEDDLSSDSATKVASQQSIKAYIDTRVGGGRVDSTGSLTTGSSGLSVVRNSTGVYTVTHNLGHTNYSVTANAEISSVAAYILKASFVQNNDFRMSTKVGATDTDVDWDFQIVSWG